MFAMAPPLLKILFHALHPLAPKHSHDESLWAFWVFGSSLENDNLHKASTSQEILPLQLALDKWALK